MTHRRHLASLQRWDWYFSCGSAQSVVEENGKIRINPRLDFGGEWAHYAIRSSNVGGKTPHFLIDKLSRWNNLEGNENIGVWSTALDTDTWYRFDNQISSGSAGDFELYNNSPFPNGTIYVAHMVLYPFSRLMRKYSEWRTRDSRITPLDIGQDIRRPNGDGRVAAAYPFIGFKITNPSGYSKNKIVLTGGVHPSEYQGMYQAEGAIEFLLSGDPAAEFLLDWADIWIYPMINPQGVQGGWFRCSPNTSTDNNRLWNGSGVSTSVDAFKASFASVLGSDVDSSLDFHGSVGDSNHYQSCYDHTRPLNVLWDMKMEILLNAGGYAYGYTDEIIVSMLRQLFENSYSSIFSITPENTHLRTHTQPQEFKTMGMNAQKILSSFVGGLAFTYGPNVGSRDFNGTTDRIDWANVADLKSTPYTISLWINIDTQVNYYYFCNHDSGDSSYGAILSSGAAGNILSLLHRTNGTSYNWYASPGPTTGTWQHVLVTNNGNRSGASDVKIYLNGISKFVSYAAGNGTEYDHTGSWSIGGRITDDTRNVDGKISQVAVWNRVLDSTEIINLAFGYSPETIPSSLIFYFKGNTSSLEASPGGTGVADGTTFTSGSGPGIIYG